MFEMFFNCLYVCEGVGKVWCMVFGYEGVDVECDVVDVCEFFGE